MKNMMLSMIRCIAGLMLALPLGAFAAPDLGRIFALAPDSGSRGVLVASAAGLYLAEPNGRLTVRANREGGFVALAASPSNSKVLFASGQSGGLLRSEDGGKKWQRVSKGGPESFGLLTVSPTNPKLLYGISDGIQSSKDGGQTWTRAGDAPDKLMSLAASRAGLYAGTESGLHFSGDGGKSWESAKLNIPVTMVSVQKDGSLFSFNWGQGFLQAGAKASVSKLSWTSLTNGFGGQAIMVLARNGKQLFAATHIGRLFVSANGGRHWTPLGAARGPRTAKEKHGEKLFAVNCQACHGAVGIGESPQFDKAEQSLAPALDDTAHAWHHTDEQLLETILKGSPAPNSRMIGWEGRLSENDAKDLIAYMKSLWNERALRCQGPKHMDPGCMH